MDGDEVGVAPPASALAVLEAPAEALAARLFGGQAPWRASPFWADGADSRHVLAAAPDALLRLRLDATPGLELRDLLRRHLAVQGDALVVAALAYDAGRALERVDASAVEDPPLPDVVIARYPAWLDAPAPEGPWRLRGEDAAARAALLARLAARPAALQGPPPPPQLTLASRMDRTAYDAALADVLGGIAAGDLYEANVARRLEAPFDPAAAPALYWRLRAHNPARYGALWALDRDLWLASSSPECLLTWDRASRRACSYPIKGTRPRGRDPSEDARLAAELASSPKDRAEHVMIVDLVRNDLGRVAEPGSVTVDDLFGVHALPTLHHMISCVQARTRPECDLADVIAALFPGGSITGAPKIAAMNRIERVEGLRRGFYTGSLAVVDREGASLNILIRTCVAADGRLLYQSGGAIVADSDPDQEWAETETKAAALVRALACDLDHGGLAHQ